MRGWHSGYCGRLQPGFSWVRIPARALKLFVKNPSTPRTSVRGFLSTQDLRKQANLDV